MPFFCFTLSSGLPFHWEENPKAQDSLHDQPVGPPLLLCPDLPPLPWVSLVFSLTSGPLHWRGFAWSTLSLGVCAVTPHLSGLGSNISISVGPSKNPLKWHHLFPTYSASTSTKILTPWTQDLFIVVLAATHAQNNVWGHAVDTY